MTPRFICSVRSLVVALLLASSGLSPSWAANGDPQTDGDLGMFAFSRQQSHNAYDVLMNPGFWFEDIGYGSTVVYHFGFDPVTGAQIGQRGQFFPFMSMPIVTGFAWSLQGTTLTLSFSSDRIMINLLAYDQPLDILYIEGELGNAPVWFGCRSPYIPAGISRQVVTELCQAQ